jgi:hypothetical protein
MNGPALNEKIAAPDGRLARLRTQGVRPEAIVEEFYLAALCRRPTGKEQDYWLTQVQQSKNPAEAMEDLIWALLNSRAFVFNR